VRVALISIAGQPRNPACLAPMAVAGKTIARHQLDFAVAAGCKRVLAIGEETSAEAIALRHAAERASVRFDVVADSHGLLGAVRADDDVLALAVGLLPGSAEPLQALNGDSRVLVLPATLGIPAGFERIDAGRAWAGAVTLPGAKIEHLSMLAPDVEPASVLMRVAMQARAAERFISEELVADEAWAMVSERTDPATIERAWNARHLDRAAAWEPSRHLAVTLVRTFSQRLLAEPRATLALIGGTLVALLVALVAGARGFAAPSFALIALAALAAQTLRSLGTLQAGPYQRQAAPRVDRYIDWTLDAALFACATLAIPGDLLHRLFPPATLLGLIYAGRTAPARWAGLLRDRGSIAALLALAGAFGLVEPVVMALALALLALMWLSSRASRLTRV
jgi:hypothetical protein